MAYLQLSTAAVDRQLDAGDAGSVVRGQNCFRGSNFARLAEPLDRDRLEQGVARLPGIGFRKAGLAERRHLVHAGADSVDADISDDQ